MDALAVTSDRKISGNGQCHVNGNGGPPRLRMLGPTGAGTKPDPITDGVTLENGESLLRLREQRLANHPWPHGE
jgi:hypothetical protein